MTRPWITALVIHVLKKPVTILRLSEGEWQALRSSRRGVGEFTIALPHHNLGKLQIPTVCLIMAHAREDEWSEDDKKSHWAYLGLIVSRGTVTTLESRIKVKHAVSITPTDPAALLALPTDPVYQRILKERLEETSRATVLSSKTSGHLLERLAEIEANAGTMRTLAASLAMPRRFQGVESLQDDAIRIALKAFGLTLDDRAISLELTPDRETALARVPIIEDGVIEHDARSVPGYDLVASDITGRAIFERGPDRLEVFTANRRQLERAGESGEKPTVRSRLRGSRRPNRQPCA